MATRNRYAELMAQYQEAQPFSFTGYPSSYTGGYDVAQPQAYAAPMNRYADIMAQTERMGGGRGEREAPSAWSQMTPAERAAYYAANPTEGKIALGVQDALGANTLGALGKIFNADNWYNSRLEKMGVNPEQFAYGPPNLNGGFVSTIPVQSTGSGVTYSTGTGDFSSQYGPDQYGPGISAGETLNRQMAQDRADAAAAQASAAAAAQAATQGGGGGNGNGGGGYSGAPSAGSDVGRSAPGSAHYAKGGHVSMMHLQGPDPIGPDDGYGALKDGEYVINDQAVKKYGIELMNAINSGKISKGKLLGLLEM
jgi:hypothetical protein